MRAWTLALLLILPSCSLSCSGDDASSGAAPPPAPTPDAGTACAEGERSVADGCEPILPASECAPGTRAELGNAACVPVGPTACADGFTRHSSGWGCVPVLPEAACQGATRDALGTKSCVPIGDCNAAFPPSGAAVFVNASFTDGEVDATHVKTIGAAIAAAPANATIAVATGTYSEKLSLTKNVTIVGRCAEKVIIDAPTTDAGIVVEGRKATIRGVTVRGGRPAISAISLDTDLTLEDSLLDANVRAGLDVFEEANVTARRVVIRNTTPETSSSITNGIIADVTSTVALEDSAIVGAADAGVGATGSSSITLTRSIVRNIVARPDRVGGAGARAFERGKLELIDSAMVASRGTGIIVGKTKASLKMTRSSIVDIVGDDRDLGAGIAVSVSDGATAEITSSTLAHNPGGGIIVRGAGVTVNVSSSAVVDTYAGGRGAGGEALSVGNGASATFDSSVAFQSTFTAIASDGVGANVTVTKSLIMDTRSSPGEGKVTKGAGGEGFTVIRGASGTISSSTIIGAREGGVAVASAGSVLAVDGTWIEGTLANDAGNFGHGALAVVDGQLVLRHSAVDDSAAIGAVFSSATGALVRTAVRRNPVGIHVQQGSSLVESGDVPDPIDPGTVVVTPDARFIENGSRVGSGEIPLPTF